MYKENTGLTIFTKTGHLTEDAISLYVDSLFSFDIGKFPPEILNHVRECPKCNHEIIEIYNILKVEYLERLFSRNYVISYN